MGENEKELNPVDKKQEEVKVEEPKKKKEVKEVEEIKLVDKILREMSKYPPLLRYALLKAEVRKISLEKDEAGYKSQYFYVPLQDMQKVFTTLELSFLLTSKYTEETRPFFSNEKVEFKNFAKRDLIDLTDGQIICSTEIDITNLKQVTDIYQIKNEILRISEPKDAWKTLYLDFFEPQNLGSISTYFQRYTYNQLYDFQETKEDKIEKKGKIEGKVVIEKKEEEKEVVEKKEEKTSSDPKEKRLADEASKIREKIKKEFIRDDIVKQLNGRKLSEMTTKETAEAFYEEMKKNYKTKENEGE